MASNSSVPPIDWGRLFDRPRVSPPVVSKEDLYKRPPPLLQEQIKFIFTGGKLKRFHARDTATSQNIADHSFGVAWFVALQYEPEGVGPRPQVIMAALAHDLGEHIAGDVPGDTKAKVPELKALMNKLEDEALAQHGFLFKLTPEEQEVLKFADIMEGLMFCIRERRLGSRACDDVWNVYWSFAMALKPDPVRRVGQMLGIIAGLHEEVIRG